MLPELPDYFFLEEPWRALNRGFVLLMTYTRPRRLTIWQSLWRFFSERREWATFIGDLLNSNRVPSLAVVGGGVNRAARLWCSSVTTRVWRPTELNAGQLDDLLERGWFRIGRTLMTCRLVLFDGTLRSALWTRLPLAGHRFSRSNRKLLSKARRKYDVRFGPVTLEPQREALYQRYRMSARGERSPTLADFLYGDAVPVSLFDTRQIDIYEGDHLVAFSWFDVGHEGAQSLMGVYEPSRRRESLGYTTMLLEIEAAKASGVRWYYPGYVLPGEPAMDYKLRIGAVEFLDPDAQSWRPWERLDRHELSEQQLRRRLQEIAGVLEASGVRTRLEVYPMFEAPAWHEQLRGCLDAPIMLVCHPEALARRQLVVTYDLDGAIYEIRFCSRVSAVAVTAEGDVGRPLELWMAEDRVASASTVEVVVQRVTELAARA